MEERFLYHIWDEGHLITHPKCNSGKLLKIIYQGQYNTGRGPDFKNAVIEIDGKQQRGDIEIHLKTSDWQAHNHHEDLFYNQVILHVVLKHNSTYSYTILENGNAVEILTLEHQLSDDILKLTINQKIPSSPAVYCDLLSAIDNDRLAAILHRAGIRRFESKIKRFNTALSLSSFDQIFYEGMFEALGYSKNKLNTLQLAQSLPLSLLKGFLQEGLSVQDLCSIYLMASGLLEKASKALSLEQQLIIHDTWEKQAYTAKRFDIDWQLFRIRPQNHPIKRIIYISSIIHNTLEKGLFRSFMSNCHTNSEIYKSFRKTFVAYKNPIGNEMMTLGKSIQDNIYLNIFLPVLCLWHRRIEGVDAAVMDAYRNFKPLQANYITRFMERYLSASQIKLANSKAIYQQGLLDIYHHWCSWHLCAECLLRNR